MKKALFLIPFFALLFFGVFSAFDRPDSEASFAGAPGSAIGFDYRKDTLTNAGTATINIGTRDNAIWNTVTTPTTFLSLYTRDVKVRPLSLSGTISVKVVLDASNMRSGTSTDWIAIDSITGTTAGRVLQLANTEATATRYRLRIIGAGTQSSTYQIWTTWKRKN